MYSGSVPTSVKDDIASILHRLREDEIEVLVQPVQERMNSTDFSVFALAFATAVCFGYDVSHCQFDVGKMLALAHLWKCMKQCRNENFHINLGQTTTGIYGKMCSHRCKYIRHIKYTYLIRDRS